MTPYVVRVVSDRMWSLLLPHFKAAEPYHAFITAEDLRTLTTQGTVRLVMVVADDGSVIGACALEVLIYPRGRVLNVFMAGAAGGTFDFVPDTFRFIEELAQNSGFAGLSFTGRKGWLKGLSGLGLDHHECIYAWKRYGLGHDAHDGDADAGAADAHAGDASGAPAYAGTTARTTP